MAIKLQGLHVELTTRCTLFCLRCGRTDWLNSGKRSEFKVVDLDFDELVHFLSDVDLSECRIRLNGNYGDPIYNVRCLDFIRYFKSRNATVMLTTNGSYKPATFWIEMAKSLTAFDKVTFSVDGSPSNFTNYRVNADWDSINVAMNILAKSHVITEWKFIPFSFNEKSIDEARSLSNSIGITNFVVAPSNRWIDNDPLRPATTVSFPRPGSTQIFDPECKKYSTYFISAAGYFYPCCYSADFRLSVGTQFENNDEFRITNLTIGQHLLSKSKMSSFFNNLYGNKLPACNFCCTK